MTDITRTPDEIVARMAEVTSRDMFGVERSRLLEALPHDRALEFLEDDAPYTTESWEEDRINTREVARETISDYLDFAWMKANARRGNSAHRAIAHFRGLLWLLGDEARELAEFFDDATNYNYYGKTHLVRASEFVGFPWQDHDDDVWVFVDDEDVIEVNAAEALGR